LHFYRGHLKCPPDFICGHEFVGEIVEKGDSVSKFGIGDKVVVPFYSACGECYYCIRGQASRCSKGELFGNSVPANTVDGGQAEYVRVPLADSTFVKAPTDIPEEMLVLMADIFPTGYFAAARFLKDLNERDREGYTAVVVGCGPVGICAITCVARPCPWKTRHKRIRTLRLVRPTRSSSSLEQARLGSKFRQNERCLA
jgi:threonine dehydrogenase-like Zn-dependent dehydrogenase